MWTGASPVPAQMWTGASPVPAQMWTGRVAGEVREEWVGHLQHMFENYTTHKTLPGACGCPHPELPAAVLS